jgi:hypothetical protein
MKNIAALACIALILSGCGQSRVGMRAGITHGLSKVDEFSLTDNRGLRVEEETNNIAPTLAVVYRQMLHEGFFIMTEPGVRINTQYTTLFVVDQPNVTPEWKTEIERTHTSIDLPILLGYNFPGTTFDVNAAIGASYTRALQSSQKTFGFTEQDGNRINRSRSGISDDGGSDLSGILAVGVLNLEKQINKTFAVGLDLRYMHSLGVFYSQQAHVYEPIGGQSEHYNYNANFDAIGVSITAMLKM